MRFCPGRTFDSSIITQLYSERNKIFILLRSFRRCNDTKVYQAMLLPYIQDAENKHPPEQVWRMRDYDAS